VGAGVREIGAVTAGGSEGFSNGGRCRVMVRESPGTDESTCGTRGGAGAVGVMFEKSTRGGAGSAGWSGRLAVTRGGGGGGLGNGCGCSVMVFGASPGTDGGAGVF